MPEVEVRLGGAQGQVSTALCAACETGQSLGRLSRACRVGRWEPCITLWGSREEGSLQEQRQCKGPEAGVCLQEAREPRGGRRGVESGGIAGTG